ncbi:uncharacterized protein LOC112150675 isoform X2 [Oryzias melastigma]|uniref:uncharacterized protein LOC112150675 isoform X2 n=1 Tax=Oryzias melastigma TaxID=30732 RepID=UPI00168D4DA9|nr:uncharacterized protein LOC112150675 isoform X2 [Oryzias melastigma]
MPAGPSGFPEVLEKEHKLLQIKEEEPEHLQMKEEELKIFQIKEEEPEPVPIKEEEPEQEIKGDEEEEQFEDKPKNAEDEALTEEDCHQRCFRQTLGVSEPSLLKEEQEDACSRHYGGSALSDSQAFKVRCCATYGSTQGKVHIRVTHVEKASIKAAV